MVSQKAVMYDTLGKAWTDIQKHSDEGWLVHSMVGGRKFEYFGGPMVEGVLVVYRNDGTRSGILDSPEGLSASNRAALYVDLDDEGAIESDGLTPASAESAPEGRPSA